MTELLSGVQTPSDAELISRVRGGDSAAYGELFSRHVDAARRLGRQLVRGHDADDLVSEAFAKTLSVLQSGGGPDVAFRAYLLTSVRRLHVDRIRAAKKVQPSDDMTLYDDGLPFQDTAVASFENGAAAKAFSSLPERWQLVLWHLEVEGQKPSDIAPLLGMSANSVSALAYRAREGLRQAFLTMHLADCATEQCRWVNQHLGAYVREGLSRRDTAKVQEHLEGCRRCTAMYLELTEVNSNLAGIIAPLLLGAAAAGYLSSTGVGLTGLSALVGRIRDVLAPQAGGGTATSATGASATGAGATGAGAITTGAAVTTGGMVATGGVVAAGVAAAATAALVLGGPAGGGKDVVAQSQRPAIVQTPSAGARDDSRDPGQGSTRKGTDDSSVAKEPAAGGGDVVVVAEIEPADSATAESGDAPVADQPPAGESGQGAGTDTQPGDPAPNPDPGGAPAPEPGPGGDPDPGPGSAPIVPPIDLPDPLPDTPGVPSPSLPDSPIGSPGSVGAPGGGLLPGDPPTGGPAGGDTDTDTGTAPGTTPSEDPGRTPDDSTGVDTGGDTGTAPGQGTGTTPDGDTGTAPGGDTGSAPGGNTGGDTGTTPGSDTGGDTGSHSRRRDRRGHRRGHRERHRRRHRQHHARRRDRRRRQRVRVPGSDGGAHRRSRSEQDLEGPDGDPEGRPRRQDRVRAGLGRRRGERVGQVHRLFVGL